MNEDLVALHHRVQVDCSGAAVDRDHLAVGDQLCGFLRLNYAGDSVLPAYQRGVLKIDSAVEDERTQQRKDRHPVGACVVGDEDLTPFYVWRP